MFGAASRAIYAKVRHRGLVAPLRDCVCVVGLTRGVARHGAPQRHGLPLPDSGRVFPDTAGEESKTCIDVCAEFAGQQDRQTRCVRRDPGTQPWRSGV